MQWTQDQAIAFEAARECISDMMGICSGRIAAEEAKAKPDPAAVERLEAELRQLAAERAALTVHDADRVATVRAVYGARVREFRAHQQLGA